MVAIPPFSFCANLAPPFSTRFLALVCFLLLLFFLLRKVMCGFRNACGFLNQIPSRLACRVCRDLYEWSGVFFPPCAAPEGSNFTSLRKTRGGGKEGESD